MYIEGMWVFTKAFENCVVRIIMGLIIIGILMTVHWGVAIAALVFIGSLRLYDSYRKEQKELEQKEEDKDQSGKG